MSRLGGWSGSTTQQLITYATQRTPLPVVKMKVEMDAPAVVHDVRGYGATGHPPLRWWGGGDGIGVGGVHPMRRAGVESESRSSHLDLTGGCKTPLRKEARSG